MSLRAPFYAAAALALINVGFGIFVLPESLARENRRPIAWAKANPFTLLANIARSGALARLTIAWSCTWIGLGALQSSLVLFTGYRFGWGPVKNGLILAVIGLSQATVEGLLLKPVNARLGERTTAIAGYAAAVLGYSLLAITPAAWTIVPAMCLIALGGLSTPSVRAMVAGRGKDDTQGEMQGILASVEGLTAVFAPISTAALFYAFTTHLLPVTFPGAPFALAAASAALAGVLLTRI